MDLSTYTSSLEAILLTYFYTHSSLGCSFSENRNVLSSLPDTHVLLVSKIQSQCCDCICVSLCFWHVHLTIPTVLRKVLHLQSLYSVATSVSVKQLFQIKDTQMKKAKLIKPFSSWLLLLLLLYNQTGETSLLSYLPPFSWYLHYTCSSIIMCPVVHIFIETCRSGLNTPKP